MAISSFFNYIFILYKMGMIFIFLLKLANKIRYNPKEMGQCADDL